MIILNSFRISFITSSILGKYKIISYKNVHKYTTAIADNAMVIAALQCDCYHYAICYIGSVAVVVPLWQKHHFYVAVLPCKRGNSSVIYT